MSCSLNTLHSNTKLYIGPVVINQCFTNGIVKIQNDAIQTTYNIRRINPYKSYTKVEDYSSKNMLDDVNI